MKIETSACFAQGRMIVQQRTRARQRFDRTRLDENDPAGGLLDILAILALRSLGAGGFVIPLENMCASDLLGRCDFQQIEASFFRSLSSSGTSNRNVRSTPPEPTPKLATTRASELEVVLK
jgi:hypothetical protein